MVNQARNVASGVASEAHRTPDAVGSEPANSTSTAHGHKPSSALLSAEGVLAAMACFILWGAFPFYLMPIHHLPSLQIVSHRIFWSCVLLVIVLAVRGELKPLWALFKNPKIMSRLTLSAVLITINWLGFIWGVGHGMVVEASLGYFINPLVNVLLGILVLRERLNPVQWVSVVIALGAVLYLSFAAGSPPWLALIIAGAFSTYGLVRKLVPVDALPGLAIETILLAPLATGYLIWCEVNGTGAFGHSGWVVDAVLVGCGPFTAIPLFLFAFGARLIPYSTIGVLLYLTPSLQLLSGIYLYHESFAGPRAAGFAMIWVALVIYAVDGLWRAHVSARRQQELAA
jgi:chloramphenicol-sensitive protein RarD